jgi:hypothetical protein
VYAPVPGQFRVKCCSQGLPLANGDDSTCGWAFLDAREDFYTRATFLDPRRPDEDSVHGSSRHRQHVEIALKGIYLPAERVAPHGDIQGAKRLLIRPAIQHAGSQQD